MGSLLLLFLIMANKLHIYKDKVIRFLQFLTADIWRVDTSKEKGLRRIINNIFRILILAGRGFTNNKLVMVASGLTYFTLLAAVPILCILLAIAKGFNLQDVLQNELLNIFPTHGNILSMAFKLVEQVLTAATKGVVIGVGIIFILWAVFSIINNIERSFNIIWQVPKSRAISRKITEFFAAMLILPILLILSSGISIFIKTNFANNEIWMAFSPIINFLIKTIPFFVTCLLFSFLYFIVPNTKVRWRNTLISGLLTGSIYHIFQYLYINGQIWVNSYNAIYGSFAAFPLLLLWVQATWMIVLLGGEITYASQNLDNFMFEKETKKVSFRYRLYFTMLLLRDICQGFAQGQAAMSAHDLSSRNHIPIRLTQKQLSQLCDLKILCEMPGPDPNSSLVYQPAMDINLISVSMVFEKMFKAGTEDFNISPEDQSPLLWQTMIEMENNIKSNGDTLVKNL